MRVKVWDLPLRLFHWSLALLVGAAWLTAEMAEDLGNNVIVLHGKIGLLILGLLVFRLVWGFVGSTYARFAQFFPTPTRLRAYFSGGFHPVGHNPLGAFSVFGLLGLLFLQVLTGLFANDDIAFNGPLYPLVSSSVSNGLTRIHHLGFDLLAPLVGLHVLAIVFYVRIKRINLLTPMVTGYRENAPGESARGGGVIAVVFALGIAVGAVYLGSGAWMSPPPAIPAGTTPDW